MPFLEKARSKLADGTIREVDVYKDLTIIIDGRVAMTICMAKPEPAPKIFGQPVLEQIDYMVDCKSQRIVPNPEAQDGMMLYDDF